MHITLAWEISSIEPRRSEIETQLRAIMKPYSWVRPLNLSFYVIKINSEKDRKDLVQKFIDIVKIYPDLNFVFGPAIPSSRYDGWLPSDMWKNINERTV